MTSMREGSLWNFQLANLFQTLGLENPRPKTKDATILPFMFFSLNRVKSLQPLLRSEDDNIQWKRILNFIQFFFIKPE